MTPEESIRRFILEDLNWARPPEDLTDQTPLMESGAVDSIGVYELVGHLETTFGVEILDEELVPENFGTITAIAQLLARKPSLT